MATLTVRIPDDKHLRLKELAGYQCKQANRGAFYCCFGGV